MSLLKYRADLRSLSGDEYSRIHDLLDAAGYIGLQETSEKNVFLFYISEEDLDRLTARFPLHLLHRVP